MNLDILLKIFIYGIGIIAFVSIGIICYFFVVLSSWLDWEDIDERNNGKNKKD